MLAHPQTLQGRDGSGAEVCCSQAWKSFSSFRSWFCAELPADRALLGRAEAGETGLGAQTKVKCKRRLRPQI